MHTIEAFYRWETIYVAWQDPKSPFYNNPNQFSQYIHDIYGYYIHPSWDFIGSETLFLKVLFVDYRVGVAIIELFGEWNDTLHNDIMHLKRNLIDSLLANDIRYFILIGENVLNFHASDECYYEEWFEEIENGWIAALNFRDFVTQEWKNYNLDYFLNFGGNLDIDNWRTMHPLQLFKKVNELIVRRLSL